MKLIIASVSAVLAVTLPAGGIPSTHAGAQTLSGKPVAIRGKISAVDKQSLEIKTAAGEVMLRLPDNVKVSGVEAAKLSDISSGSYVGTTAVGKPDGTLKALEVHIFPESARGAGEGHYPWDLQPGSTMTNGNVEKVQPRTVEKVEGRQLTVKYKNGAQEIFVPSGIPIVKDVTGDRSLLKVGTGVYASAVRGKDGALTARYIVAGVGGIMPPM